MGREENANRQRKWRERHSLTEEQRALARERQRRWRASERGREVRREQAARRRDRKKGKAPETPPRVGNISTF